MNRILGNNRFYILLVSIAFSVLVFFWIRATIAEGSLQIIRNTQVYAFSAVVYLYFALLITPFCQTFTAFAYKGQWKHARRAIGVSAFYFGFLHASFAFFGQLGGFAGLGYLSQKYLLAITLSFTALVILCLMAMTSFDSMIYRLTYTKWKLLHRFVYLAGVLIVVHALMLGSHFSDLSGAIPQIFFVALAFLLVLEASRFDRYLQNRFIQLPRFGISTLIISGLIMTYVISFFVPEGSALSLGIHSQHIQLAKDARTLPSLQGDRTKRFTVSFNYPSEIRPGQDTELSFDVYDASSGNPVAYFTKVYDKFIHLIIVDSQLEYFTHIHPVQNEKNFTITTKFPKDGYYHLYLNFQPVGAIEQQFAFTLKVGDREKPQLSKVQPDTNLTKIFDQYEITLEAPNPLKAEDMAIGKQLLTFTIKDAISKKPITNLKPYLAAFGHLVMIHQELFDYLHVHPTNTKPPQENSSSGPTVEFLPLGLYGPIKPGTYRVFAQFNPNDNLILATYTVNIQ